jgi:asparagine synthase (glutamine-hydrolysing)
MRFISELPDVYDEPFADSSQLPTLLLAKVTREHVKVALSGDGGDELFGGYDRYRWAERLQKIDQLPLAFLQHPIRFFLKNLPQNQAMGILRKLNFTQKQLIALDGLYHLDRMLKHKHDIKYLYDTIPMTVAANRDLPFLVSEKELNWRYSNFPDFKDWSVKSKMQFIDFQTYLPEDILHKVDRASMHFSLEVRVPMLNVSVVNFSSQFSENQKSYSGLSKLPLRQILSEYISEELINRPKQGFSIPLASWLRNELLSWAEEILNEELPKCHELIDQESARQLWSNFLTGKADHTLTTIWNLLIFLQWHGRHIASQKQM